MAYNYQGDYYGHRGGNRGRGGVSRLYARSEPYGQGPRNSHWSEASKDNGVQGSQYSNDGSGQNYGNNSGQRNLPGSYPHNEMRGIGRGEVHGHRIEYRQGTQPSFYQENSQKGDRAQGHGNGVQPDSYQSDSQKGNKTLGYGPWAQSGPNQGDSQKGDMTQRNSMKGDMAQSHRQGDESVSCQGDLQEGIGGTQGLGHRAEPVSYQEDLQEKSDKAQHNDNNSRQGIQPDFGQKVLWKGTEGEMVQGFEKGTEPGSCQGGSQESSGVTEGHGQGAEAGSYQGHLEKNNDCDQHNSRQGDQPIIDQKDSQKGKDGYHVECTQPSSNKDNSKEGNDMGQSHGNDSIQRTQPASHQKDSQKGSDRSQSHGNDSIQRTQPASHQKDSQKGSDRSQSHGNDSIQRTQPASHQKDSQKGKDGYHVECTQPSSNKDNSKEGNDMGQSHGNDSIQRTQPASHQKDSQKGSDRSQSHGNDSIQRTQPASHQKDSQKGSDRSQSHGNDSIQRTQPASHQKDSQKGSDRSQSHGNDSIQRTQPASHQKDSQKGSDRSQSHGNDSIQRTQPASHQKDSQKGKDGYHVECTQPSSNKDNSKEGNDMGQSHGNDSIQRTQPASHQKDSQKGSDRSQSHGNDSIQRTQPASHQKDSQKGSDRSQSHGNDSGQWNKHGPNQGNWRKGGDSSGGYYQDNRSHNYQGQKVSGQEDGYSSQASSGGGFRRDNFDQQQRKRNRVDDKDILLSKTLSFILRHGAEKLKFKLMPGGFLYVDEILKKTQKLQGFTEEDVQRIVAQNDKQRFAVQKEEGTGRLKIRANQGHTLEVEDLELTPITSADQVPMVLHGTYHDAWNSIKKQGLCRFKRNHIHFAAGEPGETGVISGMRSSCEVLIFIDLEKALQDGLKFYLSANKVILSPGNEEGYIYPCYFHAVMNRYPFQILEFDPNIKGKTVSADQISDELDKKKKKKKKNKKNKEERESNERVAPREEIEGVGDTNLVAGAGEKLKEEGKDEEDQYENAMEKCMQINVPDQWDATDNVEQNSKGTEQSEGTQGLAESEDAKGTKESKTKEKDSWSETSKSKAQSRSQALKGASKPETSKGSVIPEGEQKAIKNGAFTPEDEDEGAPTGATEDAEDVEIEEGASRTELKPPSTLGELRDHSEELLVEMAAGSADAEDETELCNQDQGRPRMDTLFRSPATTFSDKIEKLVPGPSSLWPVAPELASGYDHLHLDPNYFFLGAPSSVMKSHAATILQRVRRRALCHKDGRKIEFLSPDRAACVIRRERCTLPDGSTYELTSTWIPDPEFKETKEQPSQTEENVTKTVTETHCETIK